MRPSNSILQISNAVELWEASCPECGYPLTVTLVHAPGQSRKRPWAVCSNPEGGYCHVRIAITEDLHRDYLDLCLSMAEANMAWVERLEKEMDV